MFIYMTKLPLHQERQNIFKYGSKEEENINFWIQLKELDPAVSFYIRKILVNMAIFLKKYFI